MRLEWDEAKREANFAQHGLDFADAIRVLESDTIEWIDDREKYGETRIQAFGRLDGRVVLVVYTLRDEELYRVISMRKADSNEERAYYEYLF